MRQVEIQPGLVLDSRRAVFFAEHGILAVADLHWGYAASHRAAGNLLPAWGDETIAQDLRALLNDYRPREMLWLGDSVHAMAGRHAAEAFLHECPVPVFLLPGNHDRKWQAPREKWAARGRYFFHHGDLPQALPDGSVEVIGHFHPAFSWYDGAGTRVKLPGLVCGPRRIILPAFSPWAAGTPWNAELAEDEKLWAIAPQRIFAVTTALLRKQRE